MSDKPHQAPPLTLADFIHFNFKRFSREAVLDYCVQLGWPLAEAKAQYDDYARARMQTPLPVHEEQARHTSREKIGLS